MVIMGTAWGGHEGGKGGCFEGKASAFERKSAFLKFLGKRPGKLLGKPFVLSKGGNHAKPLSNNRNPCVVLGTCMRHYSFRSSLSALDGNCFRRCSCFCGSNILYWRHKNLVEKQTYQPQEKIAAPARICSCNLRFRQKENYACPKRKQIRCQGYTKNKVCWASVSPWRRTKIKKYCTARKIIYDANSGEGFT